MLGGLSVKTLVRRDSDYTATQRGAIVPLQRNAAPKAHPFERAREYTRALNATKLNKVFAKPLVTQLSGHSDSVCALATVRGELGKLVSGSLNGELVVWDIASRSMISRRRAAHTGSIRAVAAVDNSKVWSGGIDRTIKLWSGSGSNEGAADIVLNSSTMVAAMDVAWRDQELLAAGGSGAGVELWDVGAEVGRGEPLRTLSWGIDSIRGLKFNPVETSVLGVAAGDRTVTLWDVRSGSALHKVVLTMNSNAIAWNPMEAFNFTVANEDSKLYTFDMRNLSVARSVHMDHVSAVMDVDYSPTGVEFVTAGYDRTLRIFHATKGHSREVYHSRRMQRVIQAKFSQDSKYVFSGSDDTNIRVWKSNASETLGALLPREKRALQYAEKLQDRYQHVDQIKKIQRHRHVPKAIYNAQKERHVMKMAAKKKEDNRRAHTKEGTVENVPMRRRNIIKVVE